MNKITVGLIVSYLLLCGFSAFAAASALRPVRQPAECASVAQEAATQAAQDYRTLSYVLAAMLDDCRRGVQWRGLADWERRHPGCDLGCALKDPLESTEKAGE